MGFEFKTDQPAQKLVDSVTTLSVNEPNLAQPIFTEIEEMKLAIQFIEENELYTKFLLWCGIQEQLKKAEDNLDS